MNPKQRQLLMGMVATVVLMFIFPPFNFIGQGGLTLNAGYGFIFFPPGAGAIEASVNVALLLTRWVGVVIIGAIFHMLLREK